MKSQRKFIIILSLVFIAMVTFELMRPKPIDWRQTYSQYDKIPFGNFILYSILPKIFPKTTLETIREPIYNSLSADSAPGQLYISISKTFAPDELDAQVLLTFVDGGGEAFLSADNFSGALTDSLRFESSINYTLKFADSNYVRFTSPALSPKGKEWRYQGGTATNYFSKFDTSTSVVMVVNRDSQPTMIRMNYGDGAFYISTTPICFTNYHVLASDNREFITKAFSFCEVDEILWDEYYKVGRDEIRSPFRYILSVESLRWAYYSVLIGGLLFVVFRAKRSQRVIPILLPVTNSTLEFVDTVGRVYYQQGDHGNLVEKKIHYFLDYIRVKYYVRTNEFSEEFLKKVSDKSGVDRERVNKLFTEITRLRGKEQIIEGELESLHAAIEQFYTWANSSSLKL